MSMILNILCVVLTLLIDILDRFIRWTSFLVRTLVTILNRLLCVINGLT